jgi:hypothetical protein
VDIQPKVPSFFEPAENYKPEVESDQEMDTAEEV